MNRFVSTIFVAGLIVACNAATLNKIDPVVNMKQCPMQCDPTAGFPSGGCCTQGDAENDGYSCNNPLDKNTTSVCSWGGPVGPTDPGGMKVKPTAPLVPTTAPSPMVAPKEVLETRAPGKG